MKSDCIFCSIIAGDIPGQIVAETEDILVIKDIAPKAKIHYLIVPKQHFKDLQELEDCCLGSRMFRMAQKLSADNPQAKDYRLMVNNGYGAGQRVFHLHMHFLAGSELPEF